MCVTVCHNVCGEINLLYILISLRVCMCVCVGVWVYVCVLYVVIPALRPPCCLYFSDCLVAKLPSVRTHNLSRDHLASVTTVKESNATKTIKELKRKNLKRQGSQRLTSP